MSDLVKDLLFRSSDQDGIGWTPTTVVHVPAGLLHRAADRIEQLEAALRPFAECARVFDPDMLGGTMPKNGPWQSWPRMVDDKLHMYELTVEHLREARAALEERT